MAAKFNLGKLSERELKALKRGVENELKTSRARTIAAATKELQGRGPENCKKARPACQRSLRQEKKKPQVPCTAEVSEPERSQPDLVRPRTPARMVQRGKRQRQVSQESRSLKLRVGRHCLPPLVTVESKSRPLGRPKSLLSPQVTKFRHAVVPHLQQLTGQAPHPSRHLDSSPNQAG